MIENIDSALDWIYSFTNLELSRKKRKFTKNYKLKKIQNLLKKLENPQNNQIIIHIAGSKGKGSVAYILNNFFINSGFKTALYTSPHLFEVNERIRVNNKPIENRELLELVNYIKPNIDLIKKPILKPTFFDIFTAIAFLYFKLKKAKIWIIETGLGGRLDSTNIVTPIISIITSISREHTKILGNTLENIAREKGGIIKKNIPVVVSKNRNTVIKTLKKIASTQNAPFYYLPDYINYKSLSYTKKNGKLYQLIKIDNEKCLTSLLGIYQTENIATAKLTIDLIHKLNLIENFYKNKDNCSKSIFFNTIKNLEWYGRLTHRKIMGIDIFFDGAHNRSSASKLRKSILKMVKLNILSSDKIVSVVGILKGKDYKGILENILKFSDIIYFIEPYKWRDSKIFNYISIFKNLNKSKNIPYFVLESDNINLFKFIINSSSSILKGRNFSIVVTGSLYTVARLMTPDLLDKI